jgi:hypothetical protein
VAEQHERAQRRIVLVLIEHFAKPQPVGDQSCSGWTAGSGPPAPPARAVRRSPWCRRERNISQRRNRLSRGSCAPARVAAVAATGGCGGALQKVAASELSWSWFPWTAILCQFPPGFPPLMTTDDVGTEQRT